MTQTDRPTQLERIQTILRTEGQIDNFYCINTRL